MDRVMRAVVIKRFGEPQDVLEVKDLPLPLPGQGEVRIKLLVSPIHTHDLELIRGEYGYRPTIPFVPGSEAVGLVDHLGLGVSHLQLGQRVCVAGARATWAEYFTVAAEKLVLVPETIPDEAACQLLAMPLSACMLIDELDMVDGDWMIQNTANGTVGRIVNALARRRGINVINLVRTTAIAQAMLSEGYPNVVATEHNNWINQVDEITQGKPIVRAVDSLGGDASNTLLELLCDRGVLISFGSMASLNLNIHVDNLIYKQTIIKGFWASKNSKSLSNSKLSDMLNEIFHLTQTGKIKLTLNSIYNLEDVDKATNAESRSKKTGKIALRA
jgi:NADPH2:quinone reductase